jgi:hypothetical protein
MSKEWPALKIARLGGFCHRFDSNLHSQRFQPLYQPSPLSLHVLAVDMVTPEVGIGHPPTQQMIADHQHGVRDRHQRLLLGHALDQPLIPRG